jgi:hypothetical protein
MSNNSIPIEVIPVKLIIPPKGGGKLSDKTLDLACPPKIGPPEMGVSG